MSDCSWPEHGDRVAERARATWDVAVTRLPVGARITGSVVARQPFGVFFAVDEGHRHENHQIHVRVTRVD